MNGCQHTDVLPQGVCTECGLLVIITGQVPVSGNAGCVHGDGESICGECE